MRAHPPEAGALRAQPSEASCCRSDASREKPEADLRADPTRNELDARTLTRSQLLQERRQSRKARSRFARGPDKKRARCAHIHPKQARCAHNPAKPTDVGATEVAKSPKPICAHARLETSLMRARPREANAPRTT